MGKDAHLYIFEYIYIKDVQTAQLEGIGQDIQIHVHQFLTTTSYIARNFQHEL